MQHNIMPLSNLAQRAWFKDTGVEKTLKGQGSVSSVHAYMQYTLMALKNKVLTRTFPQEVKRK